MKQLQQGDVLIQQIVNLPVGCRKVIPAKKGYVLAKGETTGHAHVIEEVDGCEVYEKNGIMYISALQDTALVHEEHNVITIPAGTWEVGIVEEYDPFTEEMRPVKD